MSGKAPLAANDPDVKIPAAVKRNAAKADEIHKAAYQTPETPPAETPPQDAPKEPAKETSAVPAPTVTPTPAPTAPAAPADAASQNWEHLYKTWKGRYDSELPRLKDATRAQQDRIAQLEATIADLQSLAKNNSQPEPTNFEKLITDKEINDYGPELLEVIGKKAREELYPTIAKLQQENAELKNQLRGTSRQLATDARGRMYQMLDEHIPSWRNLDTDENFIAWLQLPDRYSGVIRHKLLNEAHERNDGPRVVAFFQGYLDEAASPSQPVDPSAPVFPAATTPSEGNTPPLSLDKLAAPGRARATAASPVPGDKPIIKRADITQFYVDKAAGRYTQEQAQRYEGMIFEAQRDGRIR